MTELKWEKLVTSVFDTWRARVLGGWFVSIYNSDGTSITFYPDPDHLWDARVLDGK